MKSLCHILLIAFASVCILAPNVLAIVPQSERFYVNDVADVLSSETEDYIYENSLKLDEATGAQIVVVAIKSLEGRSIEEYSTELFRSYGIGDKEKNNGLLFLFSLEDRQSRIEVGYGLEGALPDGKTGRIQDEYIIPYFRNNNFDEGVRNGYQALFQVVAEEYDYDSDVAPTRVAKKNNSVSLCLIGVILCAITSSIGSLFSNGSLKHKTTLFIILELFTIPLIIDGLTNYVQGWYELPLMFSFINFVAAFFGFSLIAGGGSGGGHSHSGRSGGGGHSGGGGRSGGGGSSRSF